MAVQSEIKTLMDSLNEPRILIREDFSVAYVNRAFVYRYAPTIGSPLFAFPHASL